MIRKTIGTLAVAASVLCLVLVLLVVASSCNFVPKEQMTFSDGAPAFFDEKGEATRESVNPETNEKREPVMGYNVGGSQAEVSKAIQVVGGVVPAPYDGIVYTAGSLLLAGLGWFLARANKKRKQALGMAEEALEVAKELITDIESTPAAKEAIKAHAENHSPQLKELVAATTGK